MISLSNIESKELVPGFHVKFVHSENMTLAYWDVEAGAELPMHSHMHEQVANILEGQFELVLDKKAYILNPGDVMVIPSQVPHSGKAITNCRILDVFHPVREDYLQ